MKNWHIALQDRVKLDRWSRKLIVVTKNQNYIQLDAILMESGSRIDEHRLAKRIY